MLPFGNCLKICHTYLVKKLIQTKFAHYIENDNFET